MTLDELIADIESRGLGWDVGQSSPMFYEARIWDWPYVIGRHDHDFQEPITPLLMLEKAFAQVDLTTYQKKK